MQIQLFYRLLLLACFFAVNGCAVTPPRNMESSCEIFYEKDDWYDDAKSSFVKWGVPIHLQLAIIYQESRFVYDAETPRDYILWVIPWGRISDAYGYAQVKDSTWEWYMEKSGNSGADRDDFDDAVDFIGWYANMSYKKLGISKWDTYNQYLAYHEGHGGFKTKTYNKKAWLKKVARKVEKRAQHYRAQLGKCRKELESRWHFWPF
jgi:hypothetical protein